MPLAVCCLAALTLLDHYNASFLHPKLDPKFESLLNQTVTLEGTVLEPPASSQNGSKLLVSLPEKVFLAAPSEDVFSGVERGDRVLFTTRLKRPVHYQNPGQFDYRRSLERRGILLTGFIENTEGLRRLPEREGQKTVLMRKIDRLRVWINQAIDRSGDGAGFLKALVTGDRSGLSEALWQDFQKTGTSHLVAISGQQIAILGAVFLTFLLILLKRSEKLMLATSVRKWAAAFSLPPVLLYILIAGSPPSAMRAAVLFGLVGLAVWTDREFDPFSALAAGVLLISALDVSAPFSTSFQLSFLAVLGVLLFRRRTASKSRIQRFLLGPLCMSFGAMLTTAPLVAYTFHQVSLSGILTNFWAIPAVGLLLILASIALGLCLLVPPFGRWALRGVVLLTGLFLNGLHRSAEWSWVATFYPSLGELFFGSALVGLAGWVWNRPRHWRFAVSSLTVLLALAGWVRFFPLKKPMEVTFLDVGQGDSALVVTPSGKTILVDGGGFLIPFSLRNEPQRFDVGEEVVVPYLKTRGIKRLDAILLSHPHPDHFGGLKAVMENFQVGEFWWNGQSFPDLSFDQLMGLLQDRKIPKRILKAGDHFLWADVDLEVIYPKRASPTHTINDNSLVVRLRYGGASVLFSGDIEDGGEQALSDKGLVDATILKIPHHASRTSSSVPFIDSVHPLYAVASLGDGNMFGFPHPGILEKYERRGVQVFRTDQNGAVTFKWGPGFPRRSISIQAVSSGGSP